MVAGRGKGGKLMHNGGRQDFGWLERTYRAKIWEEIATFKRERDDAIPF
jgi:hypothetical protein